MNKYKFRKLFSALEERVKTEGKKDPSWFLGYVEGLGTGKLTGYQIGALVNLLLVPDSDKQKEAIQLSDINEDTNKNLMYTLPHMMRS